MELNNLQFISYKPANAVLSEKSSKSQSELRADSTRMNLWKRDVTMQKAWKTAKISRIKFLTEVITYSKALQKEGDYITVQTPGVLIPASAEKKLQIWWKKASGPVEGIHIQKIHEVYSIF